MFLSPSKQTFPEMEEKNKICVFFCILLLLLMLLFHTLLVTDMSLLLLLPPPLVVFLYLCLTKRPPTMLFRQNIK